MLLNELLKQDDSKKIVEDANFIEFSRQTVKFGESLYQLRNVTGFEVGKIPKNKLPFLWILVLFAIGIPLITVVVGLILIAIAIGLIYSHYTQVQKYGLILTFNSGEARYFISSDKSFLGKIVSALKQLMEESIQGVNVNFQDRTVNVYGTVKGAVAIGDNAEIHQTNTDIVEKNDN